MTLGVVRAAAVSAVLALLSACGPNGSSTAPTSMTAHPSGTLAPAPTLPLLEAPTYPATAPVWRGDFPDPAALFVDDVYYAYATEGTLDARLQLLRSWDMVQWGPVGDALVDTPEWAMRWWSWAPAVVKIGDRFLMYYSARHASAEVQCISVAVAKAPDGRFVDDSSRPLVCDVAGGGAIDPSPFADNDGRHYLLWKIDGVSVGMPSVLVAQRLSDDGMRLLDAPSVLAYADHQWEAGQVEAPSMARVGDDYVLIYSGNWWHTSDYAVGAAGCRTPLGPCAKHGVAVLTSRDAMQGPGGAEFFRDREGTLLVAYHAWRDAPGERGHRALFIDTAENVLAPLR